MTIAHLDAVKEAFVTETLTIPTKTSYNFIRRANVDLNKIIMGSYDPNIVKGTLKEVIFDLECALKCLENKLVKVDVNND